MRCRFSYQIIILGVSIKLLKPKSWWNRRVSTNYCTSWTNQWKNNFTANFVCKRQRDSKFRLQNKTRIPDPPEISVAKYLLRFPGSILIRLWFRTESTVLERNSKQEIILCNSPLKLVFDLVFKEKHKKNLRERRKCIVGSWNGREVFWFAHGFHSSWWNS